MRRPTPRRPGRRRSARRSRADAAGTGVVGLRVADRHLDHRPTPTTPTDTWISRCPGQPTPTGRRVERALRIRRRSRSLVPPQTPWSIRLSSAYSRHVALTGQSAHTRLATSTGRRGPAASLRSAGVRRRRATRVAGSGPPHALLRQEACADSAFAAAFGCGDTWQLPPMHDISLVAIRAAFFSCSGTSRYERTGPWQKRQRWLL